MYNEWEKYGWDGKEVVLFCANDNNSQIALQTWKSFQEKYNFLHTTISIMRGEENDYAYKKYNLKKIPCFFLSKLNEEVGDLPIILEEEITFASIYSFLKANNIAFTEKTKKLIAGPWNTAII